MTSLKLRFHCKISICRVDSVHWHGNWKPLLRNAIIITSTKHSAIKLLYHFLRAASIIFSSVQNKSSLVSRSPREQTNRERNNMKLPALGTVLLGTGLEAAKVSETTCKVSLNFRIFFHIFRTLTTADFYKQIVIPMPPVSNTLWAFQLKTRAFVLVMMVSWRTTMHKL